MSVRISISRLRLSNFRNYHEMRLELEASPVILTGHNGAGKTNLLEAVSFLIPGRGMRRAKIAEIDRAVNGERHPWAIAAQAESMIGEVQIGTGRDVSAGPEADKRVVRVEGKPLKNQAGLASYMSVTWLTPQMDQLFNEGASARRKFLDRLVYGFDAEHASRVNAYEYAMRERNRLLAERRGDAHWLSSLEHKMAETGTAIAIARMQACDHMNEEMQASPLPFPKARLALEGVVEKRIAEGASAVAAEAAFAEALAASRAADAGAGRALAGVHRSELSVTHVLKNMEAASCSTGEQKALLLSIVLAEARAAAHWHGRVPIMLLDEVVAHLDGGRRQELFDEILRTGAQAWLTGTDAALFEGMRGRAQFLQVEQAEVRALCPA